MSNTAKIILVILVGIGLLLTIVNWSCSSQAVTLKNKVEAQQKVCEANFDKMWKVIEQQAQVPAQYKKDFKDIYLSMMEGRYGKDNDVVFKWINEANPQFTPELYKTLMVSIEANRNEFFFEQKKLVDVKREYDNLRMKVKIFPVNLFYYGTIEEINITVITSKKTEDAYKTGKEEIEPLFKN